MKVQPVAARALRLIDERKTLVLATADPEPWTAPVYFLYRNSRFYFFSSPESRHVEAAMATGRCAAAIFRESADWRAIEGLQMRGELTEVTFGAEAIDVFGAYVGRFPTVKGFFLDSTFDFKQFTARFRSRLYAFVPRQVHYLNNQVGFGTRREIQLRSPD